MEESYRNEFVECCTTTYGISRNYDDYYARYNETAYQLGKIFGNVATGLFGVFEAGAGFTYSVGTGGAGVVVGGGFVFLHGCSIAASSLKEAGVNLYILFASNGGGNNPQSQNQPGVKNKTFKQLKKELGSPGKNKHWHHIVEQSQIKKSGFSPNIIHNKNNVIAIDDDIHAKISGYYSSIDPQYSKTQRVRDWLAGQSYEYQYQFGLDRLRDFGALK